MNINDNAGLLWDNFSFEAVTVRLTAYRTGDNFGQAVSSTVKKSDDPSQYIVLVNDNYDQSLSSGQPDDSSDTAPIQAGQMQTDSNGNPLDPDFGKITLHLLPTDVQTGTVTLTLSDPTAVKLFKDDGSEIASPGALTLDLSNPSGDLAQLASGKMNLWFEGLKANPDFSFTVKYSDSSGNELAHDQVHVDISDWKIRNEVTVVDRSDVDKDGILDYADGFGAFNGTSDSQAVSGLSFTPISISGLALNSQQASAEQFLFQYDGSDHITDHADWR